MKAVGLFSAVLIVAFISDYSYAYVYRQLVDVVNGQCVTKDGLKRNGESWSKENPCERYSCKVTSAKKGTVEGAGCGSVSIDPGTGCTLQPGKGKYPNCCPKPVCRRT